MQINNPLVHFIIVLFGMIFSYFAITHTIKNIKLLTQRIKMRKMQAKGGSSSVIINVETPSLQGSMHCVSDGSFMLCVDNEGNKTYFQQNNDGSLTVIGGESINNDIRTITHGALSKAGGSGKSGTPWQQIHTEFPKDIEKEMYENQARLKGDIISANISNCEYPPYQNDIITLKPSDENGINGEVMPVITLNINGKGKRKILKHIKKVGHDNGI